MTDRSRGNDTNARDSWVPISVNVFIKLFGSAYHQTIYIAILTTEAFITMLQCGFKLRHVITTSLV